MRPGSRRILVIDDEEFVRDLLHDFLTRLQFEVDLAPDGIAGLDAFRAGSYSLVLVDLKMPGKSGIDVLRELRQITMAVPVIVMTGYPTIDSSIEALRLGAFDYIIKPFKLQELREVVDRAIKEQELHEEIDTLRGRIVNIEQELRAYRASVAARAREQAAAPS